MRLVAILALAHACATLHAQAASAPSTTEPNAPLPDTRTLLNEVARNQAKLEALQKDYSYHVHLVQQQTD